MTALSVPDVTGLSVPEAALAYAAAGWYVLPADGKNPGRYVGGGWQYQSSRDPAVITAWWQQWPDAGLGLHTGRSGAVVFDVDNPANVPAILRTYMPALAFQSTRDNDPERGHYVATCEPMAYGCSLGDLRTEQSWGEVKSGNSIVIAEPSPHPKAAAGGRYKWHRAGLPELPGELTPCLRPPGASVRGGDASDVLAFLGGLPERDGIRCPEVTELLGPLPDPGGRYEAVRTRTLQLARLGDQGYYGVPAALDELQDAYEDALAGEGRDAGHEYTTLLDGAVRMVLGDPTPDEDKHRCGITDRAGDWGGFIKQNEAMMAAVQVGQVAEIAQPVSGQVPVVTVPDLLAGIRTGAYLNAAEFASLRWHVDGLVPEGFTLLVGAPKAGKSWLTLGWLLDLAKAGRAVLYLALEDSDRRMQSRCRAVLGGEPIPEAFAYLTAVQPGALIATVWQFVQAHHGEAPLIVLDTLGKAQQDTPRVRDESAYDRDYRITGELQAIIKGCPGAGLIACHHDRKATSEDFVDKASGTRGITGGPDTILVLLRPRLEDEGALLITGRDVDENEYALTFSGGRWKLDGGSLQMAAAAVFVRKARERLGDRSGEILTFISDSGDTGVKTADVAAKFSITPDEASVYLGRLYKTGRILRPARGLYKSVGCVGNPPRPANFSQHSSSFVGNDDSGTPPAKPTTNTAVGNVSAGHQANQHNQHNPLIRTPQQPGPRGRVDALGQPLARYPAPDCGQCTPYTPCDRHG